MSAGLPPEDSRGAAGGDHVDVLGALTGEMPPAQRWIAAEHIDRCGPCRQELVELSLMLGELRDAARHRPAEPAEVPAFVTPAPAISSRSPAEAGPDAWTDLAAVGPAGRHSAESRRQRRRPARRATLAAAAFVVLVGVGAAGVVVGRSERSPTAPAAAGVVLTPVGDLPSAARGSAHMTGAGAAQHMHLRVTGLPQPPRGDRYDVWLIDTRDGATLDIGVVPRAGGRDAVYAAPAAVVQRYNVIDVSLQSPADGTRHSGHSVLRGAIT